MISMCIGVGAGLAAITLGIATKLLDKPGRTEAGRHDLGVALNIGGILAAVMFGLAVSLWGVWEIISSVLGMSALGTAPLYWGLWLACGLADSLTGVTLLAFGAIGIGIMTMSPERKASLARFRGRVAPVPIVAGALQIVLSIAFFLV